MSTESDPEVFESRHKLADDALEFRRMVMNQERQHGRVDPCFMTGKGCVYSDTIARELSYRHKENQCMGFLVTPFRNNLKVFFRNSLEPYFEYHYRDGDLEPDVSPTPYSRAATMRLETAEEVRRPGIIICEGICKRLQQSDFVVTDISTPNANVFYELGLAYGINHKIILIYQNRDDGSPA